VPRYRVNAKFGPWERGDEFESEDEFHANVAAQGRLLTIVDAPSAESLVGTPAPWSGAGQEPASGGGDAADLELPEE
jgi:hypothetical protein